MTELWAPVIRMAFAFALAAWTIGVIVLFTKDNKRADAEEAKARKEGRIS